MPRIAVVCKTVLDKEQQRQLTQKFGARIFDDDNKLSPARLIERIGASEIVVTNVDAAISREVIGACPNLMTIITCSAGLDHIDAPACAERKIRVIGFPDYCAKALAEKALTFVMMGLNRTLHAMRNVDAGNWDYDRFEGLDLNLATLGIIGTGRSGSALVKLAQSLDINVVTANSKSTKGGIDKLLRTSDVISIHMPANPETIGYINESRLQTMKENVCLVNVSRGKLIDESALIPFLRHNPNAAAFLDVLSCEPPAANSELRKLPNVLITPHIAWNSKLSTMELKIALWDAIKREVQRVSSRAKTIQQPA